MINNWEHHGLHIDFSNIHCKVGRPSDVDMFYITDTNFLIIGEFKNELGTFKEKQKEILETFIDNYKYNGIIIYATHNKSVENGDTIVDASQCKVEEYYYNREWHRPKSNVIVQDVFNRFEKERKMEITSNKKEIIFRSEKDGKVYYSIGLSKKNMNGEYDNGYMNVHFKNGVDIPNKSKIVIKKAWLDFYNKDKMTIPYVFISDFELVTETTPATEPTTTEVTPQNIDSIIGGKDIKIEPDDLPFY